MSIERTNIFFISGVNCNWSSVIRKKQTEGRWLVKRNLTCLRHWWSCFPTLRIPASTRQWRCYRGNGVLEAACLLANAFGVLSRIKLLDPRLRVGTRASTREPLHVGVCIDLVVKAAAYSPLLRTLDLLLLRLPACSRMLAAL